MDDEVRGTQSPARWLAWATAGLLAVGIVSAGAVSDRVENEGQRIVIAAGTGAAGVELPTTATPPPAPPPATASVVPTTAVPNTTTTVPAPTTTKPLAPTTTKAAATAAPATTITTAPAAGVMLTVVNEHPFAVVLTVNGRTFELAPGQQSGPVKITRYDHGNDIVEAELVQKPTCGMGDADSYFPTPGSYRLAVVASPGLCQPGMPGPSIKVTRA